MKKMILLFSHTLSQTQKEDAQKCWGVEEFISLPKELQTLWSNIPPQLEEIDKYLEPIRVFLTQNIAKDDIVLIQGDFGATYNIVSFSKSLGAVAVYATTKRNVVEKEIDGKSIKTSVFEHIRFREYK